MNRTLHSFFTQSDIDNFAVFHTDSKDGSQLLVRGEPELLNSLNEAFTKWIKENGVRVFSRKQYLELWYATYAAQGADLFSHTGILIDVKELEGK